MSYWGEFDPGTPCFWALSVADPIPWGISIYMPLDPVRIWTMHSDSIQRLSVHRDHERHFMGMFTRLGAPFVLDYQHTEAALKKLQNRPPYPPTMQLETTRAALISGAMKSGLVVAYCESDPAICRRKVVWWFMAGGRPFRWSLVLKKLPAHSKTWVLKESSLGSPDGWTGTPRWSGKTDSYAEFFETLEGLTLAACLESAT